VLPQQDFTPWKTAPFYESHGFERKEFCSEFKGTVNVNSDLLKRSSKLCDSISSKLTGEQKFT